MLYQRQIVLELLVSDFLRNKTSKFRVLLLRPLDDVSPDFDRAEIVARLFIDFSGAIVIGLHDLLLILEEGNLRSTSKSLQQFRPVSHCNETKIWAELEAFPQVHILPIVVHLTPLLRVCVVESNFKLLLVLCAQVPVKKKTTGSEHMQLASNQR